MRSCRAEVPRADTTAQQLSIINSAVRRRTQDADGLEHRRLPRTIRADEHLRRPSWIVWFAIDLKPSIVTVWRSSADGASWPVRPRPAWSITRQMVLEAPTMAA